MPFLKKATAQPSKPKAKISKAIKSALSTEYVQDSDDSEVENSDESTDTGNAVVKPRNGGDRPDKPRSLKTQSSKIPQSSAVKSTSPNGDAKDAEIDSQGGTTTDDDDDDDEVSSPPKPPMQSSTKRKRADSSPEVGKPFKKPLTNGTTHTNSSSPNAEAGANESRQSTTSEESESNDSASEDGSSESSEGEPETSAKTSLASPRKSSPIQNVAPEPPLPPYEPPPGFQSASIEIHPSSKLGDILAPSNLVGKEIWCITVPASVSIASMKEVPLQDISDGANVLSHKGADYCFVPENDGFYGKHALLLPSTTSNEYNPCKTSISKTLHVQQRVKLPNRAQLSAKPTDSTLRPTTHVKIPRQQPTGLKMRFHPFGASSDSESDIAKKNASKAAKFRKPESAKSAPKSKKRKRSEFANDSQSGTASPMRAKKSKPRHESPVITVNPSVNINSPAKPLSNSHETPQPAVNSEIPPQPAPQSILPASISKASEQIIPAETVDAASTIDRTTLTSDSKEKARRRAKDTGPDPEDKESSNPVETIPVVSGIEHSAPTAESQEKPQRRRPKKRKGPDPEDLQDSSKAQDSQLPTPGHSSPQKQSSQPQSQSQSQDLINTAQPLTAADEREDEKKETKEERKKRREEKRKKKAKAETELSKSSAQEQSQPQPQSQALLPDLTIPSLDMSHLFSFGTKTEEKGDKEVTEERKKKKRKKKKVEAEAI